MEGVLEIVKIEEDDFEYSVYPNELKRIIKQMEKLAGTDTNYYWMQLTKNLLACSQEVYFNKIEIHTTDFGNKNFNIRDQQMADNLLSYIHRNPTDKIVVWADNIHVITEHSRIEKPIEKEFIPMGTYIKKDLKK